MVRHTRRLHTSVLGALTLMLIACSSGDDSSALEEPASPNPGLALNGTYRAEYVTYQGNPVENVDPAFVTVRTDCPESTGPCTSALVYSAPSSGAPPQETFLDYADGAWSGTIESTFRCESTDGTDHGDQSAWNTLTVTAGAGDALSLSSETYQSSPCNQIFRATYTLTRTGDINPTVTLTPADQIEPPVDHSSSARLMGTYEFVQTPADTPDSAPANPGNTVFRIVTLCPRDEDRCVAVGTRKDGVDLTSLVLYAENGRWIGDYRRPNQSCVSDPDSPRRATRMTHTDIAPTPDDPNILTGVEDVVYDGDCPKTAHWTVVATRTGQ